MTAHLNDHFPYDIDGLVEISGWVQIRRTLTMMRLSVALRLAYRLLMPIHPPERPGRRQLRAVHPACEMSIS